MSDDVAVAMEEEIGTGDWWAVDVTDFALPRFKVAVYLAGADHFAIDKHFDFRGFIESDGSFSGGDAQLVRRVIVPALRPYTTEEAKRLEGKTLLRKRDGVRCSVLVVHQYGARLLNQSTDADGPESWASLANGFEHLDGSPCGVIEGGDPWETAG